MCTPPGARKTRRSAAEFYFRAGQGCQTRLIYRVHAGRGHGKDRRKGFTEADYARLLDTAHQQPGGPLVVVKDNLNTHVSRAMAELIAAQDWLTALIKTRLKRMQYRPDLLDGFLASTGLGLTPFRNPTNKDL